MHLGYLSRDSIWENTYLPTHSNTYQRLIWAFCQERRSEGEESEEDRQEAPGGKKRNGMKTEGAEVMKLFTMETRMLLPPHFQLSWLYSSVGHELV